MDTCNGFYEIYNQNSLFGEVTNIGTCNEISMRKLADTIINIMDSNISIAKESVRIRPNKSEVDRLYCDNTKLIENSKWRPKYSINKGLRSTVKWMKKKENLDMYKSEIFNV